MTLPTRDFIPGECSAGSAEKTFAALDRGRSTPQLMRLAQEACRSCLQLSFCQEQREDIARELATRGVRKTIIGAIAVEVSQPKSEEVQLEDPQFSFDLTYPLKDSGHLLEIIRQGFRSGQLKRRGGRPFKHHALLAAHLERQLMPISSEKRLTEQEIQQVSQTVAEMMLRYYVEARRPQKRDHTLSATDIANAASLQEVFVKDFLELRDGEYPEASELAKLHNPAFYKRIMQYFSTDLSISQGKLRSFFRNTPMDPLPRIKAYLEEKQWKSQKESIAEKIAALYSTEAERKKAFTYVKLFMQRKYIRIAYAAAPAVSAPSIIDKKTGAYLTIDDEFTYFTSQEKDAIFHSFGLDRIILGYRVDPEKLQTFFQVDDIDTFVDNNLLPYTRCPAENPNIPSETLYKVRHLIRDQDLLMRARIPDNPAFKEMFAAILQALAADAEIVRKHKITSPEYNHRLRQLVGRICFMAPDQAANMELLVDTATAFLNDAAEIQALGYANAYQVAAGYSGAFCKRLYISVTPEGSKLDSAIPELLKRNTTGQVIAAFRRYQDMITTMMPHFRVRNIGQGMCRQLCIKNLYSPDKIMDHLKAYDTLNQTYKSNMKVPRLVISYYSLSTCSEDPTAAVEDWLSATARASGMYKDKIDQSIINKLALTKRGSELTTALENYLKTVEQLIAIYTRAPHPAIDRWVCERAAFTPDPTSWITSHLKRWTTVRSRVDTSDIETSVLRRLVGIQLTDPIAGIEAYRQLRDYYKDDDYIEAWMIDDAIKWSITHAARSLNKLRKLLRSTDIKVVRLDETKTLRRGGELSQHESIKDPHEAFSLADEVTKTMIDPEALTREQAHIMRSMQALPDEEKAIIALFYELPWLLPRSMQTEGWIESGKICSLFNVANVEELESVAKQIITKLKNN